MTSGTIVTSKPASKGRRRSSMRILEALQNQGLGDAITNPKCNEELELNSSGGVRRGTGNRRRSSLQLLEALRAGSEQALLVNAKNLAMEIGDSRKPKNDMSYDASRSDERAVEWDDDDNETTPKQNVSLRKSRVPAVTKNDPALATPRDQIVGTPSNPPPLRSFVPIQLQPPRPPSPMTVPPDAPKATRKHHFLFDCDRTQGSISFDSNLVESDFQYRGDEEDVDSSCSNSSSSSIRSIFAASAIHVESSLQARELDDVFRKCALNDNAAIKSRSSSSSHLVRQEVAHPLPPSNETYQSLLQSKLVVPDL